MTLGQAWRHGELEMLGEDLGHRPGQALAVRLRAGAGATATAAASE